MTQNLSQPGSLRLVRFEPTGCSSEGGTTTTFPRKDYMRDVLNLASANEQDLRNFHALYIVGYIGYASRSAARDIRRSRGRGCARILRRRGPR
jgi:hypothetical protein